MSEVIIELNLSRRSGVLAGAVAALRPLNLEFRSQHLGDQDGQPRLTLHTEGELTDLTEIVETFSRARGVSDVADVRVDGQSVLHAPASIPEPENVAVEPITAPEKRADEPSVPESASRDDTEDAFNDHEFARHVLAGEPESSDSERATGESDGEEKTEGESELTNRPDSLGSPTAFMLRRRRRRR